jgi:hypothetical protein
MKRLWLLTLLAFMLGTGFAQDDKDKLKKTSTPTQKVHNAVSKHNKYKGYKKKHKHHGVTHKRKVDYKSGEVKTKTDK